MRATATVYDTFTPALVAAFAESRTSRTKSFHEKLVKATTDCMRYWTAEAIMHIPMADRHTIKTWLEAPMRNRRPTRFSRLSRAPKMKTKAARKRAVIARDLENSRAMGIVIAVLVHQRRGNIPHQTLRVIQRQALKAFSRGKKKTTLNWGTHQGLLKIAKHLIGARIRSRGYLKAGLREARRVFRIDNANDGPSKFRNPPGAARAAQLAQSLPYAWAEDFATGILTVAPNAFAKTEAKAVAYVKSLMLMNLKEQALKAGLAVT